MWKRYLSPLINWIAGFFSAQSETSSKRLIAFVICILYYKLNIDFSKNVSEDWGFWQLILNAVVILLIIGVATIQDVMKFFKRFKPSDNESGSETK